MGAPVGTYQPGIFLSEGAMGVPYETDLFIHQTVGRDDVWQSAGGFTKTIRLVTLLHETVHLVQDLALGTTLAHDRHLEAAGSSAFLSARALAFADGAPCPLVRRHWEAGEPGESGYRDAVAARDAADALIDEYGSVAAVFPQLDFDRFPDTLTGRALIEGVTAVRVAAVLAGRCVTDDDIDHVRAVRDVTPLLSDDLPVLYRQARELFAAVLPIELDPSSHALDELWPASYADSARACLDFSFLLVTDIALHIPPAEVQADRIAQGINEPADFSPARRFLSTMRHIREADGFPDAADPASGADGFHRQMFDDVAQDPRHNWPTLEETDSAWIQLFLILKEQRRSATDGYRARLLVERYRHPAITFVEDPLVLCLKQGVPVLHVTPTGLKVLQGAWSPEASVVLPHEFPGLDAEYFAKGPFTPWEDAPAAITIQEALEDQARKIPSLLQEVVFRSFFRALQSAILTQERFVCPFASRGCAAAQPRCRELSDLDDAPDVGCALRTYLPFQGFEPADLKWSAD